MADADWALAVVIAFLVGVAIGVLIAEFPTRRPPRR